MQLAADDPLAVAAGSAIRAGDVDTLRGLLSAHPGLARALVVDGRGVQRTLLHIACDWPGHFPNVAETIAALIAAGANPNAGMTETPLHWAASSDDVDAIDALLDGGADIEAPGAVFTGGTAMSDAVVFAQWNAARRLLERGARTTIWQSAALGLIDRVREHAAPSQQELTNALWHACRGGRRETAQYLLEHGADPHWIGHDHKTPLQVAHESGDEELVRWLTNAAPNTTR
jgi:ankyrin repeat protein